MLNNHLLSLQIVYDGDIQFESNQLSAEQKDLLGQVITASIETYAEMLVKQSGVLNYVSSKCLVWI